MAEPEEEMEALKRAYAEMILNAAKEAAERVMAAEMRTRRLEKDLVCTKGEPLHRKSIGSVRIRKKTNGEKATESQRTTSIRKAFTSPRNSSELIQWQVSEKRPPHGHHPPLPPNKSEWDSEDITKPASVPFLWEQTPGRPKNELETRPPTQRLPPVRLKSDEIPKLPPGRQSDPSRCLSGDISDDLNNAIYSDHSLLLQKLNDSLNCRDDSDSSESEEEASHTYSEALNSLSLTETLSDSKQRPSGKFCVDKQTREFMMSRFLPAAKAAILEAPQKTVISEKPNEVRKVVSREILTKPLIMKHDRSDGFPPYFRHPDFDNVESEEEDEEFSSVVPVKKPGRYSWGINIPKICANLKKPLQSMKSKSRPQTPSNGEERRLQRSAVSGPLDKSGSQILPKKKFYSGLISRDSHRLEKNNSCRSSNESCHQLLNSPNRSGPSPFRRYRSGNISPYRNEPPKSTFLSMPNINDKEDASKITSSLKMFRALQDVSRTNQVNERGPSGSRASDLVEEKTVYVDSISRRTPKPDQEKGRRAGSKDSGAANVKMYPSRGQESRGTGIRHEDVKLRMKGGGKSSVNNYTGGECYDLPLKSSLPPPLPKLPSEPWLGRTLPSSPLRNPFAHSRWNSAVHLKKQGLKDDHTKWETVVKTSDAQDGHPRYSEELIPHSTSYRQSKS